MIARTMSVCVAAALGLAVADTAAAQVPRFEVSGGYQTAYLPVQTLRVGWSADVAANLNAVWSIVGEVSGAYRTEEDETLGADVRLSLQTFEAGARWSSRGTTRIVPFLQVLAGAARASAHTEIRGSKIGDSSTKFVLQPGGGVSLKVNETFGVVGQGDYRRVFVDAGEVGDSGENQFRVFVGVRFGF